MFGWILTGAVIACFIAFGIAMYVTSKKYSYTIYGIDFRFLKSAEWAKGIMSKKNVKGLFDSVFPVKGWDDELYMFEGLEVVFTGEFPIETEDGKMLGGYYMPAFKLIVVAVNHETHVSTSGKVYFPIKTPGDTCIIHELDHHHRYYNGDTNWAEDVYV